MAQGQTALPSRGSSARGIGRLLPKLVLGLAAILMLLSLGYAGTRLNDQYRIEARMTRSGLWFASQALVEISRFRAALAGFNAGEVNADTVELRFEIMLSRFALLDKGEGSPEFDTLERLRTESAAIFPEQAGMEANLQAFLAGDRNARVQLNGALDRIEALLLKANVDLHLERQSIAAQASFGITSLQRTFLVAGAGLILSGSLLIGMLLIENRRASRLLRDAEAAAGRAAEADQTLYVLIDSLPAMIAAFDREGRYLFLNRAYEEFTRLEEQEAIGQIPSSLGMDKRQEESVAAVVASGKPKPQMEQEVVNGLGQQRTLLASCAPVPDSQGGVGRVVYVAIDITDRTIAERRIRHLAEHDMLTDLPNRLLFDRHKREYQRIARQNGTRIALYCIDIDHFRDVNDTLGHAMGDRLLLATVIRLRQCLRPRDILARLSGDEFAVLRPDIHGQAEAELFATEMAAAMARPFHIGGLLLRSGASIGVAMGPLDEDAGEGALLRQGEQALHHAKAKARGGFAFFTPEMAKAQAERRMMEGDLRQAIERGQLSLAYQPKFRIGDGAPAGCEALLRWDHPRLGQISPAVFVPLAEETGLITALTRWVLREACGQIRAWDLAGTPIKVAVNLSAVHFAAAGVVDMVSDALLYAECDPNLLEIEVTEGVFIRNSASAKETLLALRELGVHLALDDFGTGYSALGYLLRLPFDRVKIDRTFVRALREEGNRSRHVIDAIIRLAHGLGAEVIAEGVEDEQELAMLRELGCDVAQGFLLARPMPAALAAALLSRPLPESDTGWAPLFGT
ncbi:EAL domain-containing protein [Acetobacteraceae bacterium H6797]|nr:EAL domain-containing protein [Acetobacteraceae bacterium H6797]